MVPALARSTSANRCWSSAEGFFVILFTSSIKAGISLFRKASSAAVKLAPAVKFFIFVLSLGFEGGHKVY